MNKTIAQQLGITDFPFTVKDRNGNVIYFETSDGFSIFYQYDSNNNEIYSRNSSGYSVSYEYNSNNELISLKNNCSKEIA